MKTTLIILLTLSVIFVAAQMMSSRSTSNTEQHEYKVLKAFDSFEIRQYEPAIFSVTVMDSAAYEEISGLGFRRLAGYIFGDNEKQQKIAMTSPVQMEMSDSITMRFMLPKGMNMEDLPKPNNPNVKFIAEPGKIMAAIQYGGWNSDKKMAKYTAELKKLLEENNIKAIGNFNFYGYNPPYEVANRRNEVVVEVAWELAPQ